MSKVQFNLLPDVKLDFIKAQTTKRTVISIAFIVSAVALAIFLILLVTVDVVQKKQLNDADAQVKDKTQQLQKVDGLDKALTIQNQLKTLADLHKQKHINSRIFDYLPQITPTNVNVSKIDIDYETSTMSIHGLADSQPSVNTFIDTLKFTKYRIGNETSNHTAFSSVVESNFALSPSGVTFGLNLSFDPKLFSNDLGDKDGNPQTPKLEVPQLTTTRSVLESSGNPLFQELIDTSPKASGSSH
jgi:Tfp pilus assembly protein PilN